MPSNPQRPEWIGAEFTAQRERESGAKQLFLAIVYVGDQLGRLVEQVRELDEVLQDWHERQAVEHEP